MANFTVSHTTNSGANPEEYLVHEDYGQTIRFEITEIAEVDAYEIDSIVAYQDIDGTRVKIADFSNAASQIFPTGQNIFTGVVNANNLYTSDGLGTVIFVAYDSDKNEIGGQSQTINTITLPEWAKGDDVKIENFVFLDDGKFQCTVTTKAFECTSEWFPDLQLGDEVFSSSVLDPKICVETTAEVTYNGFDYEYKTVSTGLGLGGFLFSNSGVSENISTTFWLDNGDKKGWYLDKSVTYSDSTLSFSFKNDGLYSAEKTLFSTGQIPCPGLPWCQFSFELKGEVSIPAEVSVNIGKNFSVDGSLKASATITGKAGVGLGVSIGGWGINLVEAGAWGSGTISVGGEFTTNFTEAILTPAKVEISLAAGVYIDALTIKAKGQSSSAAGGLKITLAEWDYKLGASAFIGGIKTEENTATLISDSQSEWQGDGTCHFTANIHAPAAETLKYYDLVLRYAEYDVTTGEIIGEVKSEYIDKIYSNACFVANKSLNLDSSKTYMYNFAILPDQTYAYTNEISQFDKTNYLSCSNLQTTGTTVSIEKVTVKEPNYIPNTSTVEEAEFTVKLNAAVDYDVKLAWFTSDATAQEGWDFIEPSNVSDRYVTIKAGETEATFSVKILGDNEKEAEENFYVQMYAVGEAKDKVVFSSQNLFDKSDNTSGYVECVIQDAETKGAAAVTVIDVSGSMSGNKIVSAKNAAYSFINNMNIGDYIGVVSFSSSAATRYSLTQITGENIKDAAKSAVKGLSTGGLTFIGSGIQQAANMLDTVDSESKSIIVMTDGYDEPYSNEAATRNIINNLPKDQYLIYGIGYGTQASAAVDALSVVNSDITLSTSYASKTYMEELMDMCGGKYYYAATDEDLEDIYFELSARSSKQQILVKENDTVGNDKIIIKTATVDTSATSVRLGINWTNGDLDLVLWDPNGNYYDSSVNSEYIKFISTGTSEYYEITAPAKGVWGLGVVGNDVRGDEEAFDYYAIANSSIEANLEFDATRVAPNQQISVNCIVKNGDNNVLGASVYAKVLDSKGDYEFVDLFDDGMHGDGIANDGVYGNIISKDSAGVYKVTGYVEGNATMGDVFYRQTVEEQFQVDVNAKASLISITGNFGGDGKTAIVQYDYAKSLNVTGWFAQEDGSMKWQFINTVAPGWEISKITGDFTGDGTADILWINKDTGHIGTWQMDNGSCKWSILTITDFDEWSLQGIGDFNGDGTDDMLFRNRLNGLVGTLDTQNGEQVPSSWKVLDGTTDAWQIAGTGDFNGDKKDDILLTNTVTGQVGIWEMTAQGTTNWKSVSFTDFAEWRIQGIGDFNGDDVDDILFANNSTGVVGFWGMEDGTNKDWTLIGIADVKSDWQISGIGDFNNDGIDEIAWTSPTSERIGCWTQDKEKLAQWSILA